MQEPNKGVLGLRLFLQPFGLLGKLAIVLSPSVNVGGCSTVGAFGKRIPHLLRSM